jgi:hypothetical protein
MIRTTPLQSAFNFGELSPWLVARTTFDKYPGAMETCINAIPLIEGGYMRRSGSRYVAAVKHPDKATRLKRFQFSVGESHVLEMGDKYFRFYRHQAQITAPDTDAVIANGTFASGITSWTDRSTGAGAISHAVGDTALSLDGNGSDIAWAEQSVAISTAYQTSVHVLKFRVKRAERAVSGDTVEVRVGTATVDNDLVDDKVRGVGYHCIAIPAPGAANIFVQFRNTANKSILIDDVSLIDNTAVEIDSPYAEADLFQINGPQSADVLYLFHESYAPHKLQRFANNEWSLTEVDWLDGPYFDTNTTATTLTPSAATGNGITITASAVTGINDGVGFQETDIGRLVRIDNPASGVDWGYAKITGYTSSTAVIADVKDAFATTNADANWALGRWSDTTGWPKVGGFVEQRLVAAGTNSNPQTVWLSQSAADFENMAPTASDGTVADDDALDWTISSDEVNPVLWLEEQRNLVVGTTGGEWIATSEGAVITPTDINLKKNSFFGSARIVPFIAESRILFVQRAGRVLVEYGYNFDDDAFIGLDLTRLARHVTTGGVTEVTYAQQPHKLVFMPREDGTLLSLTYNRREQIQGWSRHIFGGAFGSGNAVCESVITAPGTNGAGQTQNSSERDEIWVCVKRTVNGGTRRFVEFLERDFEDGHDQEDAYYLDSLLTYDGASTSTITGLSHLEGETVGIWADGAIQADKTVASGQITLDTAASVVQVGLRYTHTLKTLKAGQGAAALAGSAIGALKRVHGITFILLNSHTLKYGPLTTNLDTTDFRVVSDPMDAGAPLFTGQWGVEFDGDWDTDARIVIESDDPAPFTLLAIAPEMVTSELA